MAQKTKSIGVKIATVKVIEALQGALAKLELDYVSQEANKAGYELKVGAWQKQLCEYVVANISKADNISTTMRHYSQTLNVAFDIHVAGLDLPERPEEDFESISRHEYKSQKEELSNAIRILKMTDEETVNTSTYNAIARYL